MELQAVVFLLFALVITTVNCNSEGDALHAQRTAFRDPNNVLQSWDPTLVNPCTWFHVTCNNDNAVIRVDLEDAGLSGHLVPQLGLLTNLQYLELAGNDITGSIPSAIGNLTKLVSLGLQNNALSGPIPGTLGNLGSLRFLRLNGNKLSGVLPRSLLNLVLIGNLNVMNVSDNLLAGTIPSTNRTGFATTTIIQDRRAPHKH